METTSTNPQLRLERVKHSFSKPARLMAFTPSGEFLVIVLVGPGGLEILDTKTGTVKRKLKTDSAIHIVQVSHDDRHIAYATVDRDVHVVDVQSGEVVCECPVMTSQVSALSFSPHKPVLAIAYCDHKICEMDYVKKKYTPWSRMVSPHFNSNWMLCHKTIRNVLYPPNNPDQKYLHTDLCLAVLDRKQMELGFKNVSDVVKKCFKYKYMIHADFLPDGTLVVVERPPAMIDEQLPPSFFRKKFGL